jgi:acetolactate synthase-1/2/3 large subunit
VNAPGAGAAGDSTAEVIAEALHAAGVGRIFAYPGDPIIELMHQCHTRGVEVILARREGTAAFMAEAHAMRTGGFGVCVSTLGPGSTALVNGVAAATLDRVPMLAFSGQIETSREPFFTHQVVNHNQLYAPVTKWAGRLEPGTVATTLRKAFSLAMAERPGAVHLTISADVSKKPAGDERFVMPPLRSQLRSVQVSAADGTDPVAVLSRARRPVVLAGIGAWRAGAVRSLTGFAERIGAPVVVSPMAKGVFPEDHPLFAGVLDMACNQLVWQFLADADLIVAAGFDAVELIKPWAVRTPVLHVAATPNTDQIYASACECVGDIGAVLDWFAGQWAGEPRWSETAVAGHRKQLRDAYYTGRVAGRLNPTDVVDVVRAAMPRDAVATTDVGSHKLLVGQGWQTYEPRTMLMTNGLSAMGFGVPAAIAAKMADPARPVVAVVGDGGFAMTATELRLAATTGLPIVFVVLVDGSLNRIELKQMALGYPSVATRIEDMDLVALAKAMHCEGARVTSATELEAVLHDAGDLSGPLVIEAHVDPSQYESQF